MVYASEEVRDEKYEMLRRVLAPVCITPDMPEASIPSEKSSCKPKELGQ